MPSAFCTGSPNWVSAIDAVPVDSRHACNHPQHSSLSLWIHLTGVNCKLFTRCKQLYWKTQKKCHQNCTHALGTNELHDSVSGSVSVQKLGDNESFTRKKRRNDDESTLPLRQSPLWSHDKPQRPLNRQKKTRCSEPPHSNLYPQI